MAAEMTIKVEGDHGASGTFTFKSDRGRLTLVSRIIHYEQPGYAGRTARVAILTSKARLAAEEALGLVS